MVIVDEVPTEVECFPVYVCLFKWKFNFENNNIVYKIFFRIFMYQKPKNCLNFVLMLISAFFIIFLNRISNY